MVRVRGNVSLASTFNLCVNNAGFVFEYQNSFIARHAILKKAAARVEVIKLEVTPDESNRTST